MRKKLLLTIAATLLLAGCAAPEPAADADPPRVPDTSPVAETPEPTPTETPDTGSEYGERIVNDRGNLVKEIGQLSGTSLDEVSDIATSRFVVTDVVVDPVCDSGFAEAPINGHFLAVHLNVETTPELADAVNPWLTFDSFYWQAYDADGKRLNDPVGSARYCLAEGKQLPLEIGPGQSVSGYVVLDVASTTGSIVFVPDGFSGWEWSY